MTCILGMRTEQATYLAHDGRLQMGGDVVTDEFPKAQFWSPGVLAAFSGSAAVFNLIELIEDRPSINRPATMAAAIRRAMRDEKWPNSSSGGSPTYDVAGFLATAHSLHGVCSSINPVPISIGKVLGFGSGGDYGTGAASLALRMGAEPAEALRLGVVEAIEAVSNCGGKITVWELSELSGIRIVEPKPLRRAR